MLKHNEEIIEKLLADEFIRGMDISSLPEIEEKGGKFYDFDGKEYEGLDIIKKYGVNYIRLRIWNEPQNVPESGGYCDLDHTIRMAKRIKAKGFKFFLDFHYSDWWADPGKQNKPKAWEDLSFDELVQAVYEYTYHVLEELDKAKAYPDMVQIGNEIRSGMLFPDGMVQNWPKLAKLINAGVKAVRDTQKDRPTAVVIHLDQGGKYHYFEDFFDKAIAHGVTDFDVIGLSYYPFWHGTFNDFKTTMDKLVDRYGKPLVVAKIAHAHRLHKDKGGMFGQDQEEISGFAASEENQRLVIKLIMNITANVKNNMGLGTFYWEPLAIPTPGQDPNIGWHNMAIFDSNGRALEALKAYSFDPDKADNSMVCKIYNPTNMDVPVGERPKLPGTVKVLMFDGRVEDRKVTWEEITDDMIEKEGKYLIKGKVENTHKQAELYLFVSNEFLQLTNYIKNPNFDEQLEGWNVSTSLGEVVTGIGAENRFPMPDLHYFYYESRENFTLDISQTIEGLEKGKYSLSVMIRGDNTTGVEVGLYAKHQNGEKIFRQMHPSDHEWKEYRIDDIKVVKDKIDIGVEIVSPPVIGKITAFKLVRTGKIED